jgi:hypothetical protein
MGPAAAFAQIGFLRTEGEESTYRLSSTGYTDDEHPIDLVRGYLVACVAESLKFEGAATYASQLMDMVREDEQENRCLKMKTLVEKQIFTDLLYQYHDVYQFYGFDINQYQDGEKLVSRFLSIFKKHPSAKKFFIEFLHRKGFEQISKSSQLVINDQGNIEIYHTMPLFDFFSSARLISRAIRNTKLFALDGRSFSEIRIWNEDDEDISKYFRKVMSSEKNENWNRNYREGFFAAHVVSAAIMESITEHDREEITRLKLLDIFEDMINILQSMNKENPEWQSPKRNLTSLANLIKYGA